MKKMRNLFLIVIAGVFFTACQTRSISNASLTTIPDHAQQQFRLNNQALRFEVVDTPQSMAQGLGDRSEIGSDGMLFVFPSVGAPIFWMKDMHFDLDLVWLKDLRVADITPNVPQPQAGQPLNQLPTYSPKVPVNMVLEIPAGTVQKWRLKIGDQFSQTP